MGRAGRGDPFPMNTKPTRKSTAPATAKSFARKGAGQLVTLPIFQQVADQLPFVDKSLKGLYIRQPRAERSAALGKKASPSNPEGVQQGQGNFQNAGPFQGTGEKNTPLPEFPGGAPSSRGKRPEADPDSPHPVNPVILSRRCVSSSPLAREERRGKKNVGRKRNPGKSANGAQLRFFG